MWSVAVVGCTGAVGREVVQVLSDRHFPLRSLRLFASSKSSGQRQSGPLGDLVVEEFSPEKLAGTDVVFLCVSGDFSRTHARALAAQGSLVIDNSSALRLDADVPLLVPEVNPHCLGSSRLIANPNCTTAIAVVALAPLHRAFVLKKILVSTYQAASGAGQAAMDELKEQTLRSLTGSEVSCREFTHSLVFNVIPHIDRFESNGYTREEMKVAWELSKILESSSIAISCTAVRVPTLRAHSEAIVIETEKPIDPESARRVLEASPGVVVRDDPSQNLYPMPLTSTKRYDVEVGRIRQNLVFGGHGLEFFVSGDQLLKGAALNAVQIAELSVSAKA